LQKLAGLQTLSLDGTKVGPAGLAQLKPLAQLQSLYLDDTQVNPVGLEALEMLPGLVSLHLANARKLSDAEIEDIHRYLPKVKLLR
jgi:hypothetical protein